MLKCEDSYLIHSGGRASELVVLGKSDTAAGNSKTFWAISFESGCSLGCHVGWACGRDLSKFIKVKILILMLFMVSRLILLILIQRPWPREHLSQGGSGFAYSVLISATKLRAPISINQRFSSAFERVMSTIVCESMFPATTLPCKINLSFVFTTFRDFISIKFLKKLLGKNGKKSREIVVAKVVFLKAYKLTNWP
jgi:hypothetical protein